MREVPWLVSSRNLEAALLYHSFFRFLVRCQTMMLLIPVVRWHWHRVASGCCHMWVWWMVTGNSFMMWLDWSALTWYRQHLDYIRSKSTKKHHKLQKRCCTRTWCYLGDWAAHLHLRVQWVGQGRAHERVDKWQVPLRCDNLVQLMESFLTLSHVAAPPEVSILRTALNSTSQLLIVYVNLLWRLIN